MISEKIGIISSELSIVIHFTVNNDNGKSIPFTLVYGLNPNYKYDKKTLYEEYTLFCEKFPDVPSQLVFTKFLKIWAHGNNLIPEEKHSNDDRSFEFRSK